MKVIQFFMLLCFGMSCSSIAAQEQEETLQLSKEKAEGLLLENNLSLLAEELNVHKADAEKIQAKVWPNPRLSIENFNPFATSYQRKHAEEQASLLGSEHFGKHRQIEVQLEQTFNLAGKRKKRQALADVSRQAAEAYLADFLLDLKTEFRKKTYDFTFHQEYLNMLKTQLNSIRQLVEAYQHQYEQGNVDKMELMRLKASQMELENEIIDEENELSELQGEFIVLMNLPEDTNLTFTSVFRSDLNYESIDFGLEHLQEQALEKRPDIALAKARKEHAEKKYDYEKSQRTPDLDVMVNYDRGGGIYPDFVGLGVAMDLPFSNPNEGKIKKAKIGIQQQEYRQDEKLREAQTDIRHKYEKLLKFSAFFDRIDADEVDDLDQTMEIHTDNFKNQSIGITTYMDFMNAYIDNKETIFDNERDYLNALEDLKYATGLELED